ncbi:conserved exported hypothetical protein [Vibrio nigripulchritudo SFn27]|uniref:Uncharacterized protein n=1 Tax=Vibrio nigripulchritudo TaxID=28173 RepID=A0A9P1NKA6_9VIBR|nr:hypothetical protein [Vibrio nigripulchritudo]CBJ93214.1 Conserved hypothetical protein (exported) [Vibrio nigripulchritudo]CCN86039.1 conserved exported hypothetical protein [Vibrio nigripulchritudo BLFn1]CCN92026.1 conserved exported hypothetical protein [Vibrio nigripulchritudo SFn27]CCN97837.1 conserved exported hypothetical protein [Vibrio nigripulchritudo ENn2]CCO44060.1 conserved exported hypothetical protein [Vibrio nigripulchritudo SFn135]
MRDKLFLFLLSVMISDGVLAESLSIPSATIPSGYDRITTSDGTTCESTIASDMYIQTGVMGLKAGHDYADNTYGRYKHNNLEARDNFGVYAQLVIPIGKKRERIDCNRLYELEIRHLKEQLVKLKLEAMTTELWDE